MHDRGLGSIDIGALLHNRIRDEFQGWFLVHRPIRGRVHASPPSRSSHCISFRHFVRRTYIRRDACEPVFIGWVLSWICCCMDWNSLFHLLFWSASLGSSQPSLAPFGSRLCTTKRTSSARLQARSMGSEWEARRTANVERNARTMRRLGLQPARAECEGSRCRTKRKRLGHEGNACRRRSARLSSSNAAVGTAPWESDVEKTKDLKKKLQDLQIPGGWTGFEHELFRYQYMSEAALWTRMRKIKRLDKLKVSGWETVRLPLGTMDLKYKRLIRVACALGWLDPCI